jgi:hypothetical protein
MSDIQHQDAITKATLLIDNGYSPSYVYEKLLKEGFSEEEAKSVLESLTDKPFVKTVKAVDGSAAPANHAQSESTGFRKSQSYLPIGIVLMLLGFGLSLWLQGDSRMIAYVILIAGPIVMLIGAFQSNS